MINKTGDKVGHVQAFRPISLRARRLGTDLRLEQHLRALH